MKRPTTLDRLITGVALAAMGTLPLQQAGATPPSEMDTTDMPYAENISEWNDIQNIDYRILEKTDETGTRIIYDFDNDGVWDSAYIHWRPLPDDFKTSLMARTLYEHGSLERDDIVYIGLTPETERLMTVQDHLERADAMRDEYRTQ